MHLSIEVGEGAKNYEQIATKEKLSDLQLRARQLVDHVDQITKEQNYQRVSCLILYSQQKVTLKCHNFGKNVRSLAETENIAYPWCKENGLCRQVLIYYPGQKKNGYLDYA